MKTNEQIFEDIKKQGYITEQQIRLLKTRGTQQNKDVFVSWERAGLERIFEQFKKWGYKVEHTDLERFDLIYIYKNRKKK